jgi:hypothetical protein
MSKYRSQGVGQNKRTTNMFYRSGISSLLSRLEKLEHQVFCCDDRGIKEDYVTHGAGPTLVSEQQSNSTILLDSPDGSTASTVTLPKITADNLGLKYKFIVKTANTGGYTIQTGDGDNTTGDLFVGGLNHNSSAVSVFAADNDAKIVLDSDATNGGGSVGSFVECEAIKHSTSGHSLWFVKGYIITADADGTGADYFQDR